MAPFSQRLAEGEPIGDALRRPKLEYFHRTGIHSLST
jgi:hypothetical protein